MLISFVSYIDFLTLYSSSASLQIRYRSRAPRAKLTSDLLQSTNQKLDSKSTLSLNPPGAPNRPRSNKITAHRVLICKAENTIILKRRQRGDLGVMKRFCFLYGTSDMQAIQNDGQLAYSSKILFRHEWCKNSRRALGGHGWRLAYPLAVHPHEFDRLVPMLSWPQS